MRVCRLKLGNCFLPAARRCRKRVLRRFEILCCMKYRALFCVSVSCIFGFVLMLLDAHAGGLRSPRGFSWPLIINATAHRCAPLFEVGDLSTEKGDTDMGGINFRDQPASHLFAGLRFCANYRCCGFLHNFRNASFQERSPQWDYSPTAAA